MPFNRATDCSSDPICIESGGQGVGLLNLAACHSCTLTPETSCELSNLYLDRKIITSAEYGYYRNCIKCQRIKSYTLASRIKATAQGKTCQRVCLCKRKPNEEIRPTTLHKTSIGSIPRLLRLCETVRFNNEEAN